MEDKIKAFREKSELLLAELEGLKVTDAQRVPDPPVAPYFRSWLEINRLLTKKVNFRTICRGEGALELIVVSEHEYFVIGGSKYIGYRRDQHRNSYNHFIVRFPLIDVNRSALKRIGVRNELLGEIMCGELVICNALYPLGMALACTKLKISHNEASDLIKDYANAIK